MTSIKPEQQNQRRLWPWRSIGCRGLLLLLLLATPAAAQPPRPSDDWPRYARDAALTGRSAIEGRLSEPHLAWSCSLAGRQWLLEILPAQGERRLDLNAGDALAPTTPRTLPAPGPRQLDLDGTGTLRPAVESYHERWAQILPQVKGWQRVAWNHTWTDQKVCRLQLFAYDRGSDQPRLVWQTDPPEATIFQPLNLVYDLDGDGVQEVCVAAHYRVMIFEGTTGRKESELRYHMSRPYGWFGLADVDADGQMELVTLGDFQSHIDVLNYDPNQPEERRLSVRWRRDLEPNIDERKKWPQIGPRPLVDVTGDGRPELVLNLFNDTGDGQWHVVVLEASTGQQLRHLPGRFLEGTADLDGDGKAELFLIGTDGPLALEFGTVELVDVRDPTPLVLWSQAEAAWGTADLPALGPTWSTTAAQGMRHVLLATSATNQLPHFFYTQRIAPPDSTRTTTVRAARLAPGRRVQTVWEASSLPADLDFKTAAMLEGMGGPAASLRVRAPRGRAPLLSCDDAQVRVLEEQPLGVAVSTPIVARLKPGGPMTVVAEGAAEHIWAVQPPDHRTNPPAILWGRPGRGMGDGSRWLGPVAADLDGDGGCEIVVADQDPTGRALLVAYRHDGSTLWQKLFPQTLGRTPVWNVSALTSWWPGHFRATNRLDLFVSTRRGFMHSDVGQLLDGRTGAVVWTQDKAIQTGQFNWGYAGIPPGVADLDGDGLDELISLYPVCFWVADGRTGKLLHGVELASRKSLPAWAAYGEPLVHAFTASNSKSILLDSPYILALLDTNGVPRWHGLGRADYPTNPNEGNVGQTTAVKHALIDWDGDGVHELGSTGYGDGVRAIDPQDGKVLWSLAAPHPTSPRVVAANIDGRPGDELLYPAGTKLVAVTGDRTAGRLLWEWGGPANLSMPAIADVDGDGLAEIVVQTADGSLHCLAAPFSVPPGSP
ncbi:MAG: hypothetical protein FJ387_07440 [Verrucomicrobia bacterium]|nr:hypothetical protein [Verrucomicrobiota bacterium]